MVALALSLLACSASPSSQPTHPLYKPGPNATVPVRITFDNRIGSRFVFERVVMRLDEQHLLSDEQYNAVRVHVRDGHTATVALVVTPGEHVLKSVIYFRGNGGYLDRYKFEIRSSRSFIAAPGLEIVVIPYEQPADSVEETPAVRYEQRGAASPAPSASAS